MSFKFKRLLKERKLVKIRLDKKLVLKEIEGAEDDRKTAKRSLQDGNFKWATIQGYYSMFHSARALLYACMHAQNFIEKVFSCVSQHTNKTSFHM